MPTIVDFPTIVQEALTVFGDVCDTEAARRHFAEEHRVQCFAVHRFDPKEEIGDEEARHRHGE